METVDLFAALGVVAWTAIAWAILAGTVLADRHHSRRGLRGQDISAGIDSRTKRSAATERLGADARDHPSRAAVGGPRWRNRAGQCTQRKPEDAVSRQVWKYTMPFPGARMDALVPAGFVPLAVGRQGLSFMLWCEVDTKAEPLQTTFATIGTGRDIPDGFTYAGTIPEGEYIWHVYWRLG